MNTHYLELQISLGELAQHPELALNPHYKAFPSEERLYSGSQKTNHRKIEMLPLFINTYLCTMNGILLPRIVTAAAAMKDKLTDYKKDQLPGGKYWAPDNNIRQILRELKPHNDICESLLGLNYWLTTPLVNAKQHTKSALILKASAIKPWSG